MAKCDLCDNHCEAGLLGELRSQFQISGVSDICPSCQRWANKTKDDLMADVAPRMREAIAAKKGILQAPKRPWWAILSGETA